MARAMAGWAEPVAAPTRGNRCLCHCRGGVVSQTRPRCVHQATIGSDCCSQCVTPERGDCQERGYWPSDEVQAAALPSFKLAPPRVDAVRLWGPVQQTEARRVGALAAASSVLLKPVQSPKKLIDELRALIPPEVLPRTSDTAASLCVRLAASSFFPSSWVLWKGHGKGGRYVDLNKTTYAQPRRLQWGVPTEPLRADADGGSCAKLLVYPHYYTRSPLDAEVHVMPAAVKQLTAFAVQLALPVLTSESRSAEPNSCELCMYFTAFHSSMGQHRDNFLSKDLVEYLRNKDASILTRQRNSQRANTNVLIWTLGNAEMVLQLSFPAAGLEAHDRSKYTTDPIFSARCGEGTLFVFSPTDDLFFCHEVSFEQATLEGEEWMLTHDTKNKNLCKEGVACFDKNHHVMGNGKKRAPQRKELHDRNCLQRRCLEVQDAVKKVLRVGRCKK
jgi:hypothetical protein